MPDGGCQCGYIRYRLTGTLGEVSVCHCTACQRQSGSAFGMSLAVPPGAFTLLTGQLRSFEVVCDSGRIKTCAFCPHCGSRIHHRIGPVMRVKAGTLDDTSPLAPGSHWWTARRQPWVTIPPDVAQCVDDG